MPLIYALIKAGALSQPSQRTRWSLLPRGLAPGGVRPVDSMLSWLRGPIFVCLLLSLCMHCTRALTVPVSTRSRPAETESNRTRKTKMGSALRRWRELEQVLPPGSERAGAGCQHCCVVEDLLCPSAAARLAETVLGDRSLVWRGKTDTKARKPGFSVRSSSLHSPKQIRSHPQKPRRRLKLVPLPGYPRLGIRGWSIHREVLFPKPEEGHSMWPPRACMNCRELFQRRL